MKQNRNDAIVYDSQTDSYTIHYTPAIDEALPLEPSGRSVGPISRRDLVTAIQDIEERLTEFDMAILTLVSSYKADPNLGNTFRTLAPGRQAAVDFKGTNLVITLG